jgi:hypothetical protein
MQLGIARPPQTPHECDNNEEAWELNYSRELETLERSRRVRMPPTCMQMQKPLLREGITMGLLCTGELRTDTPQLPGKKHTFVWSQTC